ncbi:MAG: phosphoglycerate dehydrogenase [Desulfovibrio sp.]|jgi:D-3-phosphoglycerate dehydrogenase|nr:phosphoglycerate dehydrogenase [Desulfovibrio sp.]
MKILVTPRSFGKTNPALFERLRAAGLEVVRNDTGGILTAAQMREKISQCAGVILGVDPLNAEVLAAAPFLRAVSRYGVGLDNVDLAACGTRGIAVSRTVGANSNAVADYAFSLMLAVARRTTLIDRRCREKDWGKITGIDLYGKTLGIIGFGAVGKCVARRARGFSMRVLAHDPVFDAPAAAGLGAESADADTICREADFITLHTTLNNATRNLVNARRLAMMKPAAVLVNTARGGLVDEAALLAALREGRIYGAGLDVFEKEPPLDQGWYNLDNVVLGSHCAASTNGATETMGTMAVDNLLRDLGLA